MIAGNNIYITHPSVIGAVFNGQNAADPVNEVNGVANTSDNAGQTTITSSTVDPQNGSYCLRIQNNGGGSKDADIVLVGIQNGQTVNISFYVKQVTGLAWTSRLLDTKGWSVTYQQNFNDGVAGTWELINGYINCIATQDDPILTIRTTSGGTDLDLCDIDTIVITVVS